MSPLRYAVDEYLAIRRRLGLKLDGAGRLLSDFAAYYERTGATTLTCDLMLAWARQPKDAQPIWWSIRLRAVRGFARHLHAIDDRHEVPPSDVLPAQRCRARPYLYADADLGGLMAAARALPTPLHAATYPTLIGLLAVTGMRVGEAIRLDRADLDWSDGLLTVRSSKFGKSREVVLHPRGHDRVPRSVGA